MKAFLKKRKIFCSKPVKRINNMAMRPSFNSFFFFINWVAAFLLLLACIAPHVYDDRFSYLVFLGLGVPALVVCNGLFFLFWVFQHKKKQAYVSLFTLVIGYFALGTFVKLGLSKNGANETDLKVMGFNVRVFNKYKELPSETVFKDVKDFVAQEDPDILCFQEPSSFRDKEYANYPHRYMEYMRMQGKGVLAIFSKYPIVNSGLVNFPHSLSNAAYADILYKNDTIRVYNVHLESLGITPGRGTLRTQPSDKLYNMLNTAFKKQMEQAKILRAHRASVTYKTIVCGDFNNSQYSNIYNIIKGDLQDSFLEAGTGYGRTLKFHGLPVRIDYILADKGFKVTSHKNYDVVYSDHFPVMASFQLIENE